VPLNLVPAPTQLPPPPSASACSAPLPSDVTNAGYTTIAKCDDFTAALPNTLGTGLPGGNCTGSDPSTCPANNWLGVESGPFDGQSHEWFTGGDGWQSPQPANSVYQTTDPDLGGLALDVAWRPSMSDNNAAPGQLTNGISTAPFYGGNQCAAGQHCFPLMGYIEWTERTAIHPTPPGQGFPTAGDHCCGPWEYPAAGNGYEIDFKEVYPFGWGSGGISGSGGSDAALTSYHKYGFLFTGSAGSQGACPAGYSGGCIMACVFIDGTLLNGGCSANNWADGFQWADQQMIIWGASDQYGCEFNGTTSSCSAGSNAAISSIQNCGGAICITAPQTSVVAAGTNENDGQMYPVYITGTGTPADGYYPNGLQSASSGVGSSCAPNWPSQPCYPGPTWKIVGSTWPSGGISYSGSGGVLNGWTSKDDYYKYFKIASCANWQNTSGPGCALGTIITADDGSHREGHDYSYAEQQNHPLGRLIVHADPKGGNYNENYAYIPMDKKSPVGRMLAALGSTASRPADRHVALGASLAAEYIVDGSIGHGAHHVANPRGVDASWISFLGDASSQD
jgi:hypothetical protein